MLLAIISDRDKLNGKLTRIFTGCYAYHTAWVDIERGHMYDMNLLRRRRSWPRYRSANVELYDFPKVTREHLEHRLTHDFSVYGWVDYILFGLRPIYHFFGQSTRNAGGVICSEMCNNDAWDCGDVTPWPPSGPPPSPCDLARWCRATRERIESKA